MSDIERMNRRNEDVRRQAAEAQRFKEQYTARQANTERAMAEAIDGIRPDGSSVGHVADTSGGAVALLVLVAAIGVIYVVFSAIVAIAVVGGGILVSSLVLAAFGAPGLRLVQALTPGPRPSLPRAYVTMLLAFVAFGLAAALVHGLLFVLLDVAGDRVLAAVPSLSPIAAVVRASWYFFTNSVAPDALVAALTPGAVGITLAIVAVFGFAGGVLMLRQRDRARFGGAAGILRALLLLALPLVVLAGCVIALGVYLAAAGA
jgi:hypothetical protein